MQEEKGKIAGNHHHDCCLIKHREWQACNDSTTMIAQCQPTCTPNSRVIDKSTQANPTEFVLTSRNTIPTQHLLEYISANEPQFFFILLFCRKKNTPRLKYMTVFSIYTVKTYYIAGNASLIS